MIKGIFTKYIVAPVLFIAGSAFMNDYHSTITGQDATVPISGQWSKVGDTPEWQRKNIGSCALMEVARSSINGNQMKQFSGAQLKIRLDTLFARCIDPQA
jgi:hypothetical protein